MLKRTNYSSPDGHVYFKCKQCKREFYVISSDRYHKTVCFCPYCGESAQHKERFDKNGKFLDEEEMDDEP